MISSLGVNPHECEGMLADIPTIAKKADFVVSNSRALRREMDMTKTENKQALAKNIFLFGQCMEGTQFYGLFGMVLSLARQNKFIGIGQMFRYT
ncbi:MAG TPA: response regulator SirA, partial [Opitutae bacterium]|nr:response regulator SirA [Opitutae bacterium]